MKTRGSAFLIAGLLALSGVGGAANAEESADNVVVVLDASGSMWGKLKAGVTKMDAAKKALLSVLSKVSDTTQVGLLVFSAKNPQHRGWVYPLGPRDSKRLKSAILGPIPDGSTPLGEYLKLGTDRLLEQRKQQLGYGTYRLLVVTDGEASDPAVVKRNLKDILTRGVTMDLIGVGMRSAHTLARRAHSYRSADDPASLERAVSEVFAEVSAGSGDDQALSEDFELLQPLSGAAAMAMIQALSTLKDHPIGSNPSAASGGQGGK